MTRHTRLTIWQLRTGKKRPVSAETKRDSAKAVEGGIE